MNVHCGFVKRSKPGHQTRFNIDDADLFEVEYCDGIVAASAIFGNYDIIQQPKNISEAAKENVCFYMFVDEETEAYMKNSSSLNEKKKVGIWRVVIVRNLPYKDARRNGKRNNASFAISRHYRRFYVFKEVEANKAAGKYNNASIDNQVEFYKREGLTPNSEAKLPITSDVPEGCVIIKEHIPITNLFTYLRFNEVDHFTSRDQISFSTGYHRDLLEHRAHSLVVLRPPPPPSLNKPVENSLPLTNEPVGKSTQEATNKIAKPLPSNPGKRRRKSSSKCHRKTGGGIKDSNSI
ncbi:hypothetical protein GIB67_030602 [Kingdonia uniflora]|uniref:TOD1/MUCI70 glycosyltransferase-like domain-containing protein n=1 Tax=Kingdonia uniflora TaxID=39325 RepID=A0A7J7PBW7_9MAGN|nr:hypothetical protein GIB67_030602 [Kingdonia uniflora]